MSPFEVFAALLLLIGFAISSRGEED